MGKILNELRVKEKVIAFTFDDGPNPIYTPQILEIFKKSAAKATFYMIGSQINSYPEIARAVHDQGHEIGNHTYTHPYLTKLNKTDCMNELSQAQELIKETIGVNVQTFRPPFLDCNEQVANLAESLGYTMIGMVNPETRDYGQPGVQYILDKTREFIKPGSILLFHDGYGDRSQTVEAVRTLVSELTFQGYELVTVSELLRLSAISGY